MQKFEIDIASFKLGEVSPYVVPLNQSYPYYESSKAIHNMIVTPFGPLVRRAGTKLVKELDQEGKTRLFAFEHNNNTILIAIRLLSFKFYLNGEAILVNGKHHNLHIPWNTWEDIKALNFVFQDETAEFYILSSGVHPMVLSFDKNYNFTLKEFEVLDGPYEAINKTDTTLTPTHKNNQENFLDASSNLFTKEDIGRYVRIAYDGIWGYAKITTFINTKKVVVSNKREFKNNIATSDFRLGAWGGKNGFPTLGTIFDGRLYFARNNKYKKDVWVSALWEYNNFAPTTIITENEITIDIVGYDNAINLSIPNGIEIYWLTSNKDNLLIGAKEGVYSIVPVNLEEVISPYNYTVSTISSQNSTKISLSTDTQTFYVDYHKKDIYCCEIIADKILSNQNISFLSKHLFSSKIKDMVLITYPHKMLWVLLEDGSLACATIFTMNGITNYAWQSHSIAPLSLNTKVQNFCTSYSEGEQTLWLFVTREIGLTKHNYIESLSFKALEHLYTNKIPDKTVYLDCHQSTNCHGNTISNLTQFQNTELSLIEASEEKMAENIYFMNLKVQNNEIKLDKFSFHKTTAINIGFAFPSKYTSQSLEKLSAYGQDKTIQSLTIQTINTKSINLQIGNKALQTINTTTLNINTINTETFWEISPQLSLIITAPLSMNLLSLKVKLALR